MVDFLSILNESNSTKNDETGEIIITKPLLETDEKYQINSNCKINSSCNTVIKCNLFEISAPSVSILNINFEAGVLVNQIEDFTFKNCTIKNVENGEAGLKILDCENGTISHVTISYIDTVPGLYLYQNSVIMADNLLIHDISETLLVCANASFLTLTDSTFHHSKANGIYVNSQSYVDIQNCTFQNTDYPALYISSSQCIIKNNVFEAIEQNSLSLTSSKDFIVEKNQFNDVKNSAITVFEESFGIINDNSFTKIGGNGIYCNNSEVQIKNNKMVDITFPGMAILHNSTATLDNNSIKKIEYSGISVRGAKDVKILNTSISEVKQSGISISDTENCVVQNCNIDHCDITSIESYNKSKVFVSNNKLTQIGKFAFLVYTSGYMKADHNKIDGATNAIVRLTYKGSGEFVDNEIVNVPSQSECHTPSPFFFARNGAFEGITNDPSRKNEKSVKFDNSYDDDGSGALCLKCHQKPRNCYLLECGHKVYCTDCAKKAKEANERCPLCRFPIDKVSSGFVISDDDVCIICMENKADCMILPCGHLGVCQKCLDNWLKNTQSCPICRTENATYKRIVNDM